MVCNTAGCPGSFPIFILNFQHHIFTKCGSSVDCEVGNWKIWGECSVTCNGGTKTRAREVIEERENGGATCPVLEETMACNTKECPGALPIRLFDFHTKC